MLNFSNISAQSFTGRALRGMLQGVSRNAVTRILQGPLLGARWIVGASTHGCWLGTYESAKQKAFRSLVQKGSVVFDIGANVGIYTLLASRQAGPGGRVFAIEPLERNVSYLRRHVELNRANNVEIIQVAISNHEGVGAFEANGNPHLGHLSTQGQVSVGVVTLDRLASERKDWPPGILKIDVEGGEADLLEGAVETLRRHRPIIFMATHGPELHRVCCSRLEALGYRLESITDKALEDTDELLAKPI